MPHDVKATGNNERPAVDCAARAEPTTRFFELIAIYNDQSQLKRRRINFQKISQAIDFHGRQGADRGDWSNPDLTG